MDRLHKPGDQITVSLSRSLLARALAASNETREAALDLNQLGDAASGRDYGVRRVAACALARLARSRCSPALAARCTPLTWT